MTIGNNQVNALVDTGSPISILPKYFLHNITLSKTTPFANSFTSVTGSRLHVYGCHPFPFSYADVFDEHFFYIADVTQPIVGCDFLAKYHGQIVFSDSHRKVTIEKPSPINIIKSVLTNTTAIGTQTEEFVPDRLAALTTSVNTRLQLFSV